MTRLVRGAAAAVQTRDIKAVEVTGKDVEAEDLHSDKVVEQTLEVCHSVTGGELDPAEGEVEGEFVFLHSLEAILELRKRFL